MLSTNATAHHIQDIHASLSAHSSLVSRAQFHSPPAHAPGGHLLSMSDSLSRKRKGDLTTPSTADPKKPKHNGTITSFFKAPKTSSTNHAMSNFSKENWVAGLTSEQKELLKLEIDTLGESWLAHLKDELLTVEFLNLKRFLKRELDSGAEIFPPLEDVYSWYGRFSFTWMSF